MAMVFMTVMLIVGAAAAQTFAPERPADKTVPADSLGTASLRYLISPYDSLVMACSDSAGLDWRLVSAVIFTESGFDNDVASPMGAVGLMQLMPVIAEKMGVQDPSDPEDNVRAGSRYLQDLYGRYRSSVPDSLERYKFMLAAYNAGYGRIADCMRYARYRGADASVWDSLAAVLPEMASDSVFLASGDGKLEKFNSRETLSFVDKVMKKYRDYQRSSMR